ncbi:helix-turn-helix domain-containing protein [Asticcacaulis machinosus]|uniref:AraC family transcriptional regulator n=1 Tax=Asticcacaulis machinosus TaxID=2984211 RepID=A0ABT5HHW0_9CAUL|nr:AraC family transcriptional regulator [Asticcacaulis machinosus]MDC7675745.1 AraC family transcriptional regulator [Asticcacaulis machinosus]
MLPLLAAATASALLMIALWLRHVAYLPGRTDIRLGLISGSAFYIYLASQRPAWLLPLVLAGPVACNRSLKAGFELPLRRPVTDAGVAVILLTAGLTGYIWPHDAMAARLYDGLALYLFCEPLGLMILKWSDDMVEGRRRLRVALIGISAIIGPVVAIGTATGSGETAATIGAALTLTLSFIVSAFAPRLLNTWRAPPITPSSTPALDAREQKILGRLRALMATDEAFRDPALTLSSLARRLEVPEHRLRRIIHLGEGGRNFSLYLNSYRIAAIKAALETDEDITILALALEAGYNSLSAFNRAFMASEGVTPTAYRRARMAARTANPIAATEPAPDTTTAVKAT